MALNFGAAVPDKQFSFDSFAGADFTTEASKVEMSYSPETKNMLQNKNGYVEKRTGTRRVLETDAGGINGIFEYKCAENGKTYNIIHIGETLYLFTFGDDGRIILETLLLDGLSDKKSRGFCFGGAFYIMGAGYVKIGYDDIFGTLCCGFVNRACSVYNTYADISSAEQNAPEVVFGRTKNNKHFDGERKIYTADCAYKRISFERGTYGFQDGTKLYIAPPDKASRLRVQSLYIDDGGVYTRVGERHYDVVSDSDGLYIVLDRESTEVDRTYYNCAPYVLVEYDSFVYAPTVITGRLPVRINEVGGHVTDVSGHAVSDYAPYTGEVLEGANLASGIRKIDFYLDSQSFWTQSALTASVRLYLSEPGTKGHVIGISIDGRPIQSYLDYFNEQYNQLVYWYGAEYVDLSRAVFDSFATEHIISVTYTVSGERSVIDKCGIYGIYGGSNDTRVFVSGNADYSARDFSSGLYDASYFPDTGYTEIGASSSKIVGYHKLYGNMIIVKDGAQGECAQYLRTYSISDGGAGINAVFPVKQGNISYGASCVSSFKNVGGVPLYIGPDGVFAISGTNVESQNNTQSVSNRINGRFLKEDLANAVCAANAGRYYVFIAGRAYVCDVENGCVWAYFDGLPEANCVWVRGGRLYFGTADGVVYRFMDESEDAAYYDDVAIDGSIDNARAIEAVWETPQTVLGSYTNYKTVRNCYITCMPHRRSSVKVYYNTNEDVRDWVLGENIDLFTFDDVDFSRFTFRTIASPFVFATGVKAKNVYVFGLRLVNDTPGEPFGFLALGVKYRIGKYVK